MPAISASHDHSSSVYEISVPFGPNHHMQTRAKSGIRKLKYFSDYQCYHTIPVIHAEDEPSSYQIAY